jgi:hypothetical protein
VELFGARCVVLLIWFEFVGGPDGDFESCAVADDEGGFDYLFLAGGVAGWEGEAVRLSGEEGWEEKEKRGCSHIIYIGMFKTFLYENVLEKQKKEGRSGASRR